MHSAPISFGRPLPNKDLTYLEEPTFPWVEVSKEKEVPEFVKSMLKTRVGKAKKSLCVLPTLRYGNFFMNYAL